MSKLWPKYENWSKQENHNRVYQYTPNVYRYTLAKKRPETKVYRYIFKVYRYTSPKSAQNVCFLPFFMHFHPWITPILPTHIKIIPYSPYNLFSIQFIFQLHVFLQNLSMNFFQYHSNMGYDPYTNQAPIFVRICSKP